MNKTFFTCILMLCFACCFAQDIASLKLENRQSILNDRVFLNFPKEAKNIVRATDIMAAETDENSETRIVFDTGSIRLVFFAQQLNTISRNKLYQDILKEKSEDFDYEEFFNKSSMQAVLVTPVEPDTAINAILLHSLYVRADDNTIITIGAYINKEAYQHEREAGKLAEKVFASISKGTRTLNIKQRTETWPIFGTDKSFIINLPENYIVTKNEGHDFQVLHFRKMKEFGDTLQQALTIYTGNYPGYFHPRYGYTTKNATVIKGSFLNKKVEWLNFEDAGKSLYMREQAIACDNIEKGLLAHVSMMGNTPQTVTELDGIVQQIKLGKQE